MGKTRFTYPPCTINPLTEKPYSRHRWVIRNDALLTRQATITGTLEDAVVYYYHSVCDRCGIRDPNPPRF